MTERPRLMMLTTTFPAVAGDGTPEFVLTLARALADRYSVRVVTPRVPGAAPEETIDAVEVRRFPYFIERWEGLADGAILPNLRSQPWRLVEAPSLVAALVTAALREARRWRPDVVDAHWIFPAGLAALMLRRRNNIPYLLTAHGADAYTLNAFPFSVLKRRILRGASVVAPVSREIARRLGMTGDDLDRLVVPMGVDAEAIRQAVGIREPEPGRLLFVGRLADKKGVEVLLRALPEVHAAQLVVIGDGPERAHLEDLRRSLGIEARVEFLGRCPRARVIEELRRAQALVIPSVVGAGGDREGTPVVLGEALAARVPVVASRIGGLEENLTDGVEGILVPPGSPERLAEALRLVTSAGPVAASGRDTSLGPLDIEFTRRRYLELLDLARGPSEERLP